MLAKDAALGPSLPAAGSQPCSNPINCVSGMLKEKWIPPIDASPDAPHLHFQVTRSDANYWNGTPIDVRGFISKPGRMRN